MAELDTDDESDGPDNPEDLLEADNVEQETSSKSHTAAESTTSAAPAKYVPPAMRKAAASHASTSTSTPKAVEDPRLRRLLMGLLNRLSPTSFPTLVLSSSDPSSLHSIYMSNSRGTVNALIVALILEIVSAQGEGIGDTQVVVLTALVKVLSTGLMGGMNASGGKETAASLLDGIIKRLDKAGDSDDKERLNLVGFLAQLYNFQVVAAGLIYELIREFIQNGLLEKDVESLLRIMKGKTQPHT